MFEISELKAKTLADLQVISKSIGLTKTSQLKKLDLVYQILDTQAADPAKTAPLATNEEVQKTERPKRKRVTKSTLTEEKNTKIVLENPIEEVISTSEITENKTIQEKPAPRKPIEKRVPRKKIITEPKVETKTETSDSKEENSMVSLTKINHCLLTL